MPVSDHTIIKPIKPWWSELIVKRALLTVLIALALAVSAGFMWFPNPVGWL